MTFPTDLSGAPILVTMEPWDDYDTEPLSPFPFRLLGATIPGDAEPRVNYAMSALLDLMPKGRATVASR